MKKIILSAVFLIFILLVAAAVWWWCRPQVITFDDGSTLKLLAVQYGKHHEAPNVSGARRGRPITTTNDTLVAWVLEKSDKGQWHSFQFFAYDKAMTACADSPYGASGQGGAQVVGVRLNAFPHRQSHFLLKVLEQSNNGQEVSDQSFTIHTPHAVHMEWTPDTLPSTQEDQDLTVTLTKLVTGTNVPITRDSDNPDDAMNRGVLATFQVARNGHSVTNWQPVSVETSDATGNDVNGQIFGNTWDDDADTAAYQFGLWPDEPAWKIRLEFSQQSDFAPEELWNVSSIPIVPGKQNDFWNYRRGSKTNSPFAETDLNGFHLKIFPAQQFTDMPPNSQPQGGLIIQITPPLSDGMRLTIAKLTDDQTNDINFWENSYNPSANMSLHQCQLQNLGDATNLNLTIALHKSRFVEFTAKPEFAPPPADNSQ